MEQGKLVIGNWKMHKTLAEAERFIQDLAPRISSFPCRVYLAVPFTSLAAAATAARGGPIVIGAQNMNEHSQGAYTGEISGEMLKDAGAGFVLLGHSERRKLYAETDALIRSKLKQALSVGLAPVLCIGEDREQRASGKTREVLKGQLVHALEGLTADQLGSLMIAYEPVWAIGTGIYATPAQAQEEHRFCREVLEHLFGPLCARKTPLLYGGSVNPANASSLLHQPDVDGVLVGGGSLAVEQFFEIITNQRFVQKPDQPSIS